MIISWYHLFKFFIKKFFREKKIPSGSWRLNPTYTKRGFVHGNKLFILWILKLKIRISSFMQYLPSRIKKAHQRFKLTVHSNMWLVRTGNWLPRFHLSVEILSWNSFGKYFGNLITFHTWEAMSWTRSGREKKQQHYYKEGLNRNKVSTIPPQSMSNRKTVSFWTFSARKQIMSTKFDDTMKIGDWRQQLINMMFEKGGYSLIFMNKTLINIMS